MSLMGEDGLGYELAEKVETNGSWKLWLGDNLHSQLLPHLISSASWKLSMSVNPSKSTSDLQLQIRIRALLFHKASASLFAHSSSSNSCYSAFSLQLHVDDIYYSLEKDFEDWARLEANGSLTVESLQTKVHDALRVAWPFISQQYCSRTTDICPPIKTVAERDELVEMNYVRKHAMEQELALGSMLNKLQLKFSNASVLYSSCVNLAIKIARVLFTTERTQRNG